jgi:hypothetical protein
MLMFATMVTGLAFAAPSAAQAGLLVQTATDCEAQTLEQPFTRWLDHANYTLVPNGTIEDGANRWTGGTVVSGNEPWNVHGAGESSSLKIASGRSVTSDTICVGLDHPTMRFFAKSNNSSLLGIVSVLAVEVVFEDAGGNVRSLPIGVVTPNSKWQPSLPLPVLANLLPLLPGETTPVRFRFTAVGGASWQIDDVYVDPRARA